MPLGLFSSLSSSLPSSLSLAVARTGLKQYGEIVHGERASTEVKDRHFLPKLSVLYFSSSSLFSLAKYHALEMK